MGSNPLVVMESVSGELDVCQLFYKQQGIKPNTTSEVDKY